MKHLLILLIAFAAGFSANASSARPWELDVGIGAHSDRGLFGFQLSRSFGDSWDVHANYGVDLIGTMYGAGANWNFYRGRQSCWFFFECEDTAFVGGSLVLSKKSIVTITTDDGAGEVSSDYAMSPGVAEVANLGLSETFNSGFTTTLIVSYRVWSQRPTEEFVSGTDTQKHRDAARYGNGDGLGVSFSLGWRW